MVCAETYQRLRSTPKNHPTQPHTILHNPIQFYTTLYNSTQLYTILYNPQHESQNAHPHSQCSRQNSQRVLCTYPEWATDYPALPCTHQTTHTRTTPCPARLRFALRTPSPTTTIGISAACKQYRYHLVTTP